jgi:hypothetical protein
MLRVIQDVYRAFCGRTRSLNDGLITHRDSHLFRIVARSRTRHAALSALIAAVGVKIDCLGE